MDNEKEIEATVEQLVIVDITNRICGWYNATALDKQVTINEMLPFQPEQGEEIYRPFTELEVEWKCLYEGLLKWYETSVIENDNHNKIFLYRMMVGLNSMFFTFASGPITGRNDYNAAHLYWGVRRYDNKMYWVKRKPTPMEELEEKARELGLNPITGGI